MKIKRDDQVVIIAGKDKGRKGKVIEALPKSNRIVVENINLVKKHNRPKKSGEKGQIVEMPISFNVSNVKLMCPKCNKASRVGYKIEGLPAGRQGSKKQRICKKCQASI